MCITAMLTCVRFTFLWGEVTRVSQQFNQSSKQNWKDLQFFLIFFFAKVSTHI